MYWNTSERNMSGSLFLINRNMRCIEMIVTGGNFNLEQRLIETWDVLKSAVLMLII